MKKFLAIVLVFALALSICACGTQSASDGYTVGICQLVQHPALDEATKGFREALIAELGEDKVTFDEQNASGSKENCTLIVNNFVSKNVDLIMANATDALTAAASATDTIPIIATSITEYGAALDMDNFSGKTGRNISGTSDLAPLDQQAAMFKEWAPNAKKIGIIYCSAEANSLYQVNVITKELQKLGLEVKAFAFTDSNDVSAVTAAAAEFADAIYIPTDNTAASNSEAIANVLLPAKKVVIAGEEGICSGCGVATLTINYYDIGYAAGKMAADVLKGNAKIEDLEIGYAPKFEKKFNEANCKALGLTAPEGYVAIEG